MPHFYPHCRHRRLINWSAGDDVILNSSTSSWRRCLDGSKNIHVDTITEMRFCAMMKYHSHVYADFFLKDSEIEWKSVNRDGVRRRNIQTGSMRMRV